MSLKPYRKALLLAGNWLAALMITAQAADLNSQPDQLTIHPATEGLPRNTNFTIKVRNPGREWREIPAYLVKVDQVQDNRHTPQNSSVALFDFSGTAEISVQYNSGAAESVRIRPLSYGIQPSLQGNTINFSLSNPCNVSVEVNGDIFHNLQILATPLETNRPEPADAGVIYYAPGIHDAGTVLVPSGKTVYLAGGALVRGEFRMNHAENVRIAGRGILYGSRNKALLIESSTNVTVEGITVVPVSYTVQIGQSSDVTIRNIKSFSAGGNNDGIDVFCSTNITIDGVFMRNSDDCIAIYGHRWRYYGDVSNVTVRNSTLWADVAHPILVGTHGDTANSDTLENLRFSNLDILDQMEPQIDYQGCMSLNAGDGNLIRNVRFEDIRVEDFRQGQLVNLRVFYNRKYNTSPGRGIEDVHFKNVSYSGSHANLSVIAGYDESREIKNVVFENLVINGTVISDRMTKPAWYKTSDLARFYVGEHVEGLQFLGGDGP